MVHKDLFSKIAKRILRKNGVLQNPHIMHPVREWVIGWLVALLLFSVTAVWSVGEYIKYRDITIEQRNIEEEVVVYRASMVTSALKEFEQRAITHQSLITQSGSMIPVVEEVLSESVATSSNVQINQESINEGVEFLDRENENEVLLPDSE